MTELINDKAVYRTVLATPGFHTEMPFYDKSFLTKTDLITHCEEEPTKGDENDQTNTCPVFE